ncbi:hypothetical protein C8T65DRAFT_746069 [Cerioporus squamosus]|nr:hypothetical protein C8T65DRAFT_746069 [Cerioporus squamosus]
MNLLELNHLLTAYPEVTELLTWNELVNFCDLVWWLKAEISAPQPPGNATAPLDLPAHIAGFFGTVFSLPTSDINRLWATLRDLAWEGEKSSSLQQRRAHALLPLFLKWGKQFDLCFYNLRPPTRVCSDPRCSKKRARLADDSYDVKVTVLGEARSHDIVIFTRDLGPVPAKATSLYCRGCKTRYYHNYFVHDRASTRTYYSDPPPFIQIAQHFYVSSEVCEDIANSMVLSWTSATNAAEIYNLAERPDELVAELNLDSKLSKHLTTIQAWDAFFTHSLLLHHQEHGTTLELDHNAPSHAERLRPALQARNLMMVGPGQEEWSHACDLCCWVHENEEGETVAVRSVVTDGVTVGHPCCGSHDCKEPIVRRKGGRYCATHAHLELQCSVVESVESHYQMKGKAMFQLRERWERVNESRGHLGTQQQPLTTSVLPDASLTPTAGADAEEFAVFDDGEIECEEKSSEGNRPLKALLGRRHTHNEELCVASCGVVLGRATFFGSEAVNGVLQFWRVLFPTKRSQPQVHWHDQNCRLRAMLNNKDQATRDFFADCALPVDVFHFKCKHKASDVQCNIHCNPYNWPELRTPDGKWRFNSSAAEQANAWFCKYHAIVREMDVDRYNFFLDEMIKRRNRLTVQKLCKEGHCPYRIPRDFLLDTHDALL